MTITPTFNSNQYTGYSVTLPPALDAGTTVYHQIFATPTSSGVTLTYTMKDAPAELTTSSEVIGEETVHYIENEGIVTRTTGTLCIGVHYENLTATYEIGVIIDPEAE